MRTCIQILRQITDNDCDNWICELDNKQGKSIAHTRALAHTHTLLQHCK